VRRRTFVGLTSASLFSAMVTNSGEPDCGTAPLAAALADYSVNGTAAVGGPAPDLTSLALAVAQVKRHYQACRYATVTRDMPTLITRLQVACALLPGPGRLRACTLSAEAHHVAAQILLKAGDHGLGWVAADRSMEAARTSQDPVTIGCSARIVTHAMMASGHPTAAAATARAQAERLDRVRPRQRQAAPGQRLPRPRRRRNRARRRPDRRPGHHHPHRAKGHLPRRHRTRVPSVR